MKTLYKLNASGQISWWRISLNESIMKIEWGHRLPISVTENIIEETLSSPEKGAQECQSRINKQIDRRGYEEDIPTSRPILPMRCQEFKGLPKFESYALQPKLDGIRALVSKEQIVSRTNKILKSIPHIELYANHLPDDIILDGELIIRNTPLNIIEGYVMKQYPDLKTCKEIEFHIFDIVDTEAPFIERIKCAEDILAQMEDRYLFYKTSPKSPYKNHPFFSAKFPFKIVPTIMYEEKVTQSVIDEYFKEKTKEGHEGIIIRNLEGPYDIGIQSRHILKLKEFFDNEFEIVDVVEGKGEQGIFVCRTHSHKEFSCSFKGTHAIRKQQLKDREFYIGKWLKVEHEGINPDTGKPRCPIGVHWFKAKDHD